MLRTRKTEAGPAKPACPAHAASDAGEKTTGDRAGCGPRPQRALPWALGRHASVPRSGARRTVLPDPPLQEGSAVCTQTQLAEADPPAQDIGLGWSAGGGGGEVWRGGEGPQGALARDQSCSNIWRLRKHHVQGRTPKAIFGFAWTP